MGRAELGGLIADRYQFRVVLRRGGMGAVWLAGDELLHRQGAVREIPWVPQPGAEGQESRCKGAFREARAGAGLDHPDIAGVYDVGRADGRLLVVVELCPLRVP